MERQRILVGVDGSAPSIEALRYGARLADALDAPLEAVTTWTFPPVMGAYVVDGWTPDEDAQGILDDSIAEAFGDDPPDLARTVLAGPAAGTLIEESRRARMLVLGSRGHGGFAGLLLGSVSAACAAHAHCPVLILHGGESAASAP
ncbi:universal stress protein [Agromyces rhizosphaerae]|uniref:Universal stress protein n=1 Tax=Agromyces rhizosphaerae TaxID=88374 RepID=A0A9W6FQ14_9MICO|nr:universal stress protein [Agromyces rhizosphaerae]GLI28604.1 universal stress protein [Agromyces rhizosphaerae]